MSGNDLVVGLGEVGKPLAAYLKLRGFDVDGFDTKLGGKVSKTKYDFVHICIPYSEDFEMICEKYKKFGPLIIHSTVKPGTSKKLGAIYSPVRGLHNVMLFEMQTFSKYYSGPKNPEFEKRFPYNINNNDSEELEATKILVDTTYYLWLIKYRELIDSKFKVDWSFANEIHRRFGNRPVMYNPGGPIGGHCVVPNLDLIDFPELKAVFEL